LLSILDESQAKSFTEKLFELVDDFGSSSKKSRKRKEGGDRERDKSERPSEEMGPPEAKKARKFEDTTVPAVPEPGAPSPGQLTADKVRFTFKECIFVKSQNTTVYPFLLSFKIFMEMHKKSK
jgi:hypothetical protein